MFFKRLHRFLRDYEDSIQAEQLQPLSGGAFADQSGEAYTMFEKITLWLAKIL